MRPSELRMTMRMIAGIYNDIHGTQKEFEDLTDADIENTLVSEEFEETGVVVMADDLFSELGR